MKRRVLLQTSLAFCGAGISWCGLAQQRSKPAVVAVLSFGSPNGTGVPILKSSLRDFGWIEGQNVVYEVRWAQGHQERLPVLAQELVELNPDVIWTGVSLTALAAKRATSIIPIVFAQSGDPVGFGLAETLARPGGNATGVSSQAFDIAPKHIELLRAAVPWVRRVALLRNPSAVSDQLIGRRLQEIAPSLTLTLVIADVRGPDSLDEAFTVMQRERVDAVIVSGDVLINFLSERVNDLVGRYRLPAICSGRILLKPNILMSYGQNAYEAYRLSAKYVDRILRGAKPGDLPIEQPTRVELVINLRVAKAMGLTIPQSLLLRADELIE